MANNCLKLLGKVLRTYNKKRICKSTHHVYFYRKVLAKYVHVCLENKLFLMSSQNFADTAADVESLYLLTEENANFV